MEPMRKQFPFLVKSVLFPLLTVWTHFTDAFIAHPEIRDYFSSGYLSAL